MKTLLVTLLSLGAAFSLSAAETNTLTFTAPIASPQNVEIGWKWYYRQATNTIVSNTPPTFLEFTRAHVQNTFDAHGYQFYNGYLSVQADRAKAKLVRQSIEGLSNENLELLFRISAALATNTVAASNAIISVVP